MPAWYRRGRVIDRCVHHQYHASGARGDFCAASTPKESYTTPVSLSALSDDLAKKKKIPTFFDGMKYDGYFYSF